MWIHFWMHESFLTLTHCRLGHSPFNLFSVFILMCIFHVWWKYDRSSQKLLAMSYFYLCISMQLFSAIHMNLFFIIILTTFNIIYILYINIVFNVNRWKWNFSLVSKSRAKCLHRRQFRKLLNILILRNGICIVHVRGGETVRKRANWSWLFLNRDFFNDRSSAINVLKQKIRIFQEMH